MMRVIVDQNVVAEAPVSDIKRVDGKTYFPALSVKQDMTKASTPKTSCCAVNGSASHLDIVTSSGKKIPNAIWYYAQPKDESIKGYYGFDESAVEIKEESA